MIHDGSGLCIGNAAEMREMADLLDRQSDNIAAVYADKAGGDVADWRALMTAETWYSAEEAVAAGLADEVSPSSRTSTTENSLQDSWDLSIFRYPSRAEAPAPVPVNAAMVDPPAPTESVAVEQTAEAPAEELEPPAAAEAEVETDTTPLTEPDGTDPWGAATEHLISVSSADAAFATLTEALL
jgi:hypothetical protein